MLIRNRAHRSHLLTPGMRPSASGGSKYIFCTRTITAAARFLPVIETKLVFLNTPLADAIVAHGEGCERAISLEDFAPMGFIG